MLKNRKQAIWILSFLGLECILYILLLFAGGKTEILSSYLSIVFCFLFALLFGRKHAPLITVGLACTLGADFFLVICNPRQQLWGMVFFLAAQIFYAVFLHSAQKNKYLLIGRILLVLLVEVIAGIILKDKLDLLAIVSVCYYVNLIMNMLTAFSKFRQHPLLAIGFAFFILCDTIIGLQVAAEGYLPIGTDTLLYQVLFIDFNLAWVFYLPSQVLIALSTIRHKK